MLCLCIHMRARMHTEGGFERRRNAHVCSRTYTHIHSYMHTCVHMYARAYVHLHAQRTRAGAKAAGCTLTWSLLGPEIDLARKC